MSRRYGHDEEFAYLAIWRVGRRVPRNVYARMGDDRDDDVPIGSFDTDVLAARAVADHNRSLEGGDTDA